MAIDCKLCGREVRALDSGRCRRCRRLVCGACIAEGGPGDPAGLVCTECKQEESVAAVREDLVALDGEAPLEAPVPPEESGDDPLPPPLEIEEEEDAEEHEIPVRQWVLFGLVLFLLFLLIALFPVMEVKYYSYRMHGDSEAGALDAGRALAEMGGKRALDELTALAVASEPEIRARAIEALGFSPSSRATETLRQIHDTPETPQALRLLAREALFRQARLHPTATETTQ